MPIIGQKPTTLPAPVPNLPSVQPKEYKSIVVDDNALPLRSLLAYVEGSSYVVNYYSQVLSRDNDLRELDSAQSGVYQQYQKILQMELRLTSALVTSYDANTAITAVTGTALVYPCIVPNVSDYFITSTADSREGIFRITNIERKVFNRESVYQIDFELTGYVDVNTDIYESLQSKSIRTYHYSKDRLVDGLSPLLKEEDYQLVTNLSYAYRELVQSYFQDFFSRKTSTLLLPGQDYWIYDSGLSEMVSRLVEVTDAPEIAHVRPIPLENNTRLKQPNLWQALQTKSPSVLRQANRKYMPLSTKYFNNNPYVKGLYYSGVGYIMFPVEVDVSKDILIDNHISYAAFSELVETSTAKDLPIEDVHLGYQSATGLIPLIKPALSATSYVLSESFYDTGTDMSVLEILIKDYMAASSIDLKMLSALVYAYPQWRRLDQFYFGPLLMLLIKQAQMDQHS